MTIGRTVPLLYRVQVLDRALGILQTLADAQSDLAPAEIAERVSLHKSTIHRLVTSLERYGYIRKQPTIRNHSGNVVASIRVAGPAFRIGRARIPALGRVVVAAADRLSVDLGYSTVSAYRAL